jgi:(p)ppGpp synthase/HD superfamily hydrolase
VLTPQASIVELPRGATPVDFAYSCTPTWATAAGARASMA